MYLITNDDLVDSLVDLGYLKTQRVIEAFRRIDRRHFVLEYYQDDTYVDAPLSIGYNQTISQPRTVAFMLELLDAKIGDVVLDIGSGSGWTTGLLSYIVGNKGHVTGVERVPELVEYGRHNLAKLNIENAEILKADITLGIKGKRFDKILVSASARDIPKELFSQLNVDGNIVIPIEDSIYLFHKISDQEISRKVYWGFSFVPLIY